MTFESSIFSKILILSPASRKDLNVFLIKLLQDQKPMDEITHPKAGCMKGIFKMKADFDQILEDFKEYM